FVCLFKNVRFAWVKLSLDSLEDVIPYTSSVVSFQCLYIQGIPKIRLTPNPLHNFGGIIPCPLNCLYNYRLFSILLDHPAPPPSCYHQFYFLLKLTAKVTNFHPFRFQSSRFLVGKAERFQKTAPHPLLLSGPSYFSYKSITNRSLAPD